MSDRTRLDSWLKYVCLFKHRSEATESCRGGHVRVNEVRAKPAMPVHEGDVVEVMMDRPRKFVVLSVPDRQVARGEARTMYRDESPEPVTLPFDAALPVRDRGAGRPTKRERRELERIHGDES